MVWSILEVTISNFLTQLRKYFSDIYYIFSVCANLRSSYFVFAFMKDDYVFTVGIRPSQTTLLSNCHTFTLLQVCASPGSCRRICTPYRSGVQPGSRSPSGQRAGRSYSSSEYSRSAAASTRTMDWREQKIMCISKLMWSVMWLSQSFNHFLTTVPH